MPTIALLTLLLGQTMPSWKEIDTLIDEQKLEAASKKVETRLQGAKSKNDAPDIAKSLVKLTTLRIALGGYETAVQLLKKEPWPEEPTPRALVELAYVSAVNAYQQAYSYDIVKREKVESKAEVDLSKLTQEQLRAQVDSAFVSLWKRREALGSVPVDALRAMVEGGTFPKEIRGTARDTVSYLWAESLANTAYWTPEESNSVYELDFSALVKGEPGRLSSTAVGDGSLHPLVRLAAVLDDVEKWHKDNARVEAALSARLVRVALLRNSFVEVDEREAMVKTMLSAADAAAQFPFSAYVRAQVAQWQEEAMMLRQAHDTAQVGSRAFPKSVGGKQCAHIVARLEAPDFSIVTMSSDGPRKRSVELSTRNLSKLYARAYKIDAMRFIEQGQNQLADPGAMTRLLATKAMAQWSIDLPATPDFKSHRTFVTPPLDAVGGYVLLFSPEPDFRAQKNLVMATGFTVTQMVMSTQLLPNGQGAEALVVDGSTGASLAGVDVELWGVAWNQPKKRIAVQRTDSNGLAKIDGSTVSSYNLYLVARKGEDTLVDNQAFGFYRGQNPPQRNATVLFTDRAIYRPLQKIRWKVIHYGGDALAAKWKVAPNAALTVVLRDANGQQLATAAVKTNAFGSASGEFTIPTGKLLGNWSLQTANGSASIRVEEYKRPTFEVTISDATKAMKLNAPASLSGNVKYYYGLPVTNGTVRYRVRRQPKFPWWWGYWGIPQGRQQVIASGKSALKPDGTFDVNFMASADPRLSKDVTYNYELEADVTDEGGETRSATKSFRLGNVAVEATFKDVAPFVAAQEAAVIGIVRTDLNGTPRKGKGNYRLIQLKQPNTPRLPADEPVERNPSEAKPELITAGDEVRPRHQKYDATATLRSWGDGVELTKGETSHDEAGVAQVKVAGLPAGAYRIRYETVDEFGAKFEMAKELLVVGASLGAALPAIGEVSAATVSVGSSLSIVAASGFVGQPLLFEVLKAGKVVERKWLKAGQDPARFVRPITAEDRGGFLVQVTAVKDWQEMRFSQAVSVPWDDRVLKLEYSTFRDKLRPGSKETFRVLVKDSGRAVAAGSTEVLASMYDRSLDAFAPHPLFDFASLLPNRALSLNQHSTLKVSGPLWQTYEQWFVLPNYDSWQEEQLMRIDSMGIGGMGTRGGPGGFGGMRMRRQMMAKSDEAADKAEAAPEAAMLGEVSRAAPTDTMKTFAPPAPVAAAPTMGVSGGKLGGPPAGAAQGGPPQIRSNFAETAFFYPHLVVDAKGQVGFEFEVPDSVTSWRVWAHAIQGDLKSGVGESVTRSVKELMVRPILPRFLRESDDATISVLVSNASSQELSGEVSFDLIDPKTEKSVAAEFQLKAVGAQTFQIKAGQSTSLAYRLVAPKRVGEVAVKVVAKSAGLSDGELRVLPLLPSRMHLAQSRFVTLKDKDQKVLTFADLAKNDDATRINEQMVVTIDAQLFYSVLTALPYLVRYPYECTEQTVNRFVSTGIVSSVFRDYPQVATMAAKMAERKAPFETFDGLDPNRKIQLEESPWLNESKGGNSSNDDLLVNMLRPDVVTAERQSALAKLAKLQQPNGGFSWFSGGPPSLYMTTYVLSSFSKAAEFKVDVPKDMAQRAWSFVAVELRKELFPYIAKKTASHELATLVAYVASNFPDASYLNGALTDAELAQLRDYSFQHWKQHPPLLKGMLALTLHRAKRPGDAKLVFDSVMDSAKTTAEDGTFWQPEARGWLWYNDSIEGHAFALRVLMELSPKEQRRAGLVQWLLMNKKLNHWKSTRSTAEVIYSLTKYLDAEKQLGLKEESNVQVGSVKKAFVFEPNEYTGKKNQLVIEGAQLDGKTMSSVSVSKATKGFQFASATWHFSTDKLPTEERGDLFNVKRRYFRREKQGAQVTLAPLEEGAKIEVGDELEVQLSVQARQAAEYVHLRDPRGAGFEPEGAVSRYKYDLGIVWYEEFRDSGTNFFFERLPAGEYVLKYRVRAATQGVFRVGPSTLQSMYAPEFTAYSTGQALNVGAAKPVK